MSQPSNQLLYYRSLAVCALCFGSIAFAQPGPKNVVVAEAKLIDAPATITLVGTVDAIRRSQVSSEIAGLVESMPAREGDRIEADGLICKLRDESLRYQVDEARANLQSKQTMHAELIAGSRKEEIARSQALLEEAQADYERWQQEWSRVSALYSGSESNVKEFHETRASQLQAKGRMLAAQANHNMMVAGPRQEVIARAAYEVNMYQSAVKRLDSDLEKLTIIAPFGGYVVQRLAEVGEWISAGDAVIELAELSSVYVRVSVPESAYPYQKIGDKVRVKVDALQQFFDGTIKRITPQADRAARTFPVDIEIDNRAGILGSGMFARAVVPAGPKQPIIAVPDDAIIQRGGIDYVAIVHPGPNGMMGILMGVTVGVEVNDWIAITSGNVKPGMKVVTRGTESIMPFPTDIILVDRNGTPLATKPDEKHTEHAPKSHAP